MPAEAIDKTKLLIAQVKKTKDTDEAINLLADIIQESQEANMIYMEKIDGKIDLLSKTIMGNGHPEDSMCSRLHNLEKKVNWLFGVFGALFLSLLIYFVTELIKLV